MGRAKPLVEVVSDGDRLVSLQALRDRIAATIDATDSARDVAALSRQLTDVLEQIEAIERARPQRKGTPLDELAQRRSGRGAGAKGGAGAAGGKVGG